MSLSRLTKFTQNLFLAAFKRLWTYKIENFEMDLQPSATDSKKEVPRIDPYIDRALEPLVKRLSYNLLILVLDLI